MPHTESGPFPAWIGVGGSPQSVIRAARYGFSLMLAIIGGSPGALRAVLPALPAGPGAASASRRCRSACTRPATSPPPTSRPARSSGRATWRSSASVSKTRGFAVPTKESFLHEVGPHGALYVGSPETVAQKIAANLTALGANRFDLKYGMGGLSHEALMTNIELYGTQVIPRVRELLA